jgi:starch phosphorylase
MEIALESGLPTYSGGLGALAGDTIRSAADLEVPMVAMCLLYNKGYFLQRLDEDGTQRAQPIEWSPDTYLDETPGRAVVGIEGRDVRLRAWKYDVTGITGHVVPVYFLDANLPENTDGDRALTDHLYGGDDRYRLSQEVLLGRGGVKMLRALGYDNLRRFHLNEGHAALLTLELLEEEAAQAGRTRFNQEDVLAVRAKCVFTTHTPVPAGHDQFSLELVDQVLPDDEYRVDLKDKFCVDVLARVLQLPAEQVTAPMRELALPGATLNMTYLALNMSRYVNGVAKKHGEVSRLMFAGYEIDAITNGVHAATWVDGPIQALLDRYVEGWKADNFSLRYALNIPREALWEAHLACKRRLVDRVNRETNAGMDPEVFTIAFARRAATYKRGDLLLTDVERLKRMVEDDDPFQIVYAGKAHPRDTAGQEMIRRVYGAAEALRGHVPVAYLENYDMDLARAMTAGSDLWLNTPLPPNEASGTSGMKAALNGVPSLSTPDGWWLEGCIEGVTGWAIGKEETEGDRWDRDAESIYQKLKQVILPLYYRDRAGYLDVMRNALALNGSFFNTHRMVQQYVLRAYFAE